MPVAIPGALAQAPPAVGSHPSTGLVRQAVATASPARTSATLYTLSFVETGLPAGTSWYVNLTTPIKATASSTTNTVTFQVANGTYIFLVQTPIATGTSIPLVGSLDEYVGTTPSSLVVVNGSSTTGPAVTYSERYLLAVLSLQTSGGVVSGGGYFAPNTTQPIAASPNPGYVFTSWTGICYLLCSGAYSGTSPIAAVTMGGPIVEDATFTQKTYSVNFAESGLAAGTAWSVTFNGTSSGAQTTSTISFTIANGTYAYSVPSPVAGTTGIQYLPTANAKGNTTVNGKPVTLPVPFAAQYYLTTRVAAGAGNVTPKGGWYDPGSNVTLSATPATGYAFIGWTGEGNGSLQGTANPLTIQVNGPITENATFARTFPVVFSETGLPGGTNWSVDLGTPSNTTGTNLTLTLPNGTYAFRVGLVSGYHVASAQGKVTVSGATNVTLTFVRTLYTVTFTGYGNSSRWFVSVNGVSNASTALNTVTFALPNGTSYAYVVSAPSGYDASPSKGTFTVHNASVSLSITFHAAPSGGLLGLSTANTNAVVASLVGIILVLGAIVIAMGSARASQRRTDGPSKSDKSSDASEKEGSDKKWPPEDSSAEKTTEESGSSASEEAAPSGEPASSD